MIYLFDLLYAVPFHSGVLYKYQSVSVSRDLPTHWEREASRRKRHYLILFLIVADRILISLAN